MKRFLAVLAARNKEFMRDRSVLAWNFILPIFIIAGFAYAFSDRGQELYKAGIYGTPPAQKSGFLATRYIEFVPVTDLQRAITKVDRHQLDILIDLEDRRYWVNRYSPSGYMVEKVLLSSEGDSLEKQTVTGRAIRYIDWVIPGVLGMNMMFSALFGVGYVIVRYRKNGMLKRLKATPLTAFEYITAQVVSRLWLIMLVSAIIYTGSHLMLHFTMHGSYFNLILVFALGAFSLISLGLLIASRTASEELAGGLLNLLTWPMMFLSGVWFSLEGTPRAMQWLAQIFPLTHVTEAARAIMIDGAGLAEISPHLLVLVLMSLVFLFLGARLFRWE